jgi:hypothetical protein
MASIKIKPSIAAPVSPSVNIEDEGVLIVSTQDLNFVGAGVTVTEDPAGTAKISIPGMVGGIAIGDAVAGAASGDMLFVDSAIQLAKNSLFKFNTANTRLGIGTNTPLGVLHLKTAAAATRMLIDGDAAQNKILTYRTNGLQRFGLYTNNTAESGSNAGSDFQIRAYDDAGSLLTTPLFIKRSTGNIGINTNTAIGAKLNIAGSGATNATKSIFIQNSATTETFSMSDSGIGLISNSLGINGGVGGSTFLGQIMRLAVNDFSRFGDIRIGGTFGSGLGYIQSDALNAIEFSTAQIRFCNGWIASANVLKLGTTVQRGRIEINTLADARAILIQADAAQAVPLVEFRNSANNLLGYIAAKGEFYVGSGTISASAAIQADSTTQGFLPPRMTTVQRDAIATPATGLEIYNTTTNSNNFYNGTAWEDTKLIVTNRQTASYTLVLADANKLVEMNVGSANNLTVPLDSSVAYSIGTQILISQYGTGQTTVVATGGVTIRSSGGKLKLTGQYSGATLIKIATDEWYLFGDIAV